MSTLIELVTSRFPDAVVSSHDWRGDQTVVIQRAAIVDVASFVKTDPALAMNFLMDLTVVDYSTFDEGHQPAFFSSSGVSVKPSPLIPDSDAWPGRPSSARFAVVYHFYSTSHKHRLRVIVPVEESECEVDSLVNLWHGANWFEREAWDMFGVVFRGHPDLTRILMYEEFEGHPLRKDYRVNKRQPLIGPVN